MRPLASPRDSDAAHIKQDLQQNGITVASVGPDLTRPDTIQINGAPADRGGDVRSVLNSKYGTQYDIASGANNAWTLTMKPSAVAEIKKRALTSRSSSSRTRVERARNHRAGHPGVQPRQQSDPRGIARIDDLGRVKDVIQSTARLEIHAVLGGPYTSEQDALQQLGGSVPIDSIIVPTAPGVARTGGVQYYQIKRSAEVGGTDLRSARTGRNSNTNEPEVDFYPDDCGR